LPHLLPIMLLGLVGQSQWKGSWTQVPSLPRQLYSMMTMLLSNAQGHEHSGRGHGHRYQVCHVSFTAWWPCYSQMHRVMSTVS
jgi:hypothetical protein